MSERLSRQQNLISGTQEELEKFKGEETPNLSSYEDLRERYGYRATTSVYKVLGRVGLVRERKLAQEERGDFLPPSRELAWVIAVLSASGSVGLSNGSIVLNSADQDLQLAFLNLAGGIFGINTTYQTVKTKTHEYSAPQFNNTRIARKLGNLQRSIWPSTIVEKHGWILVDPTYTWAFLAGIFDDKGLFTGRNQSQIFVPTAYRNVANFIAEMMTRGGVQNPLVINKTDAKEGVQGVVIANIRDTQIFAENVHSVIPEKEERLDTFREDTTRTARNQAPQDENELIAEWNRLFKLLGHPPNVTDITELYTVGETSWSAGVYARVFGNTRTTEGRSYTLATQKLLSANPDGQDQLLGRYRRSYQYKRTMSDQDLVAQYKTIRVVTLKKEGRLPNSPDFDKAKKSGLVNHSRVTFANRFGGGSLVEALTTLERYVFIDSVSQTLQDYEAISKKEIRFTPKTHRIFDEEALAKLDKILNEAPAFPPLTIQIGIKFSPF